MLASTLERHHLARFRAQLGIRAADLKRRIAAARDAAPMTMGAEVHDSKDRSVALASEEVRLADVGRERIELTDIELALARIEVGTYGMCCDCGRPIGRRRLEAYPAAKRCADCQATQEQRPRRSAGH